MAWIALAVFIVGTGLILGLRTLVQWRRTGDTGHRLDSGPRGSARWWAQLLFAGSNLLVAGGPIASLAGLGELDALDRTSVGTAGLFIACAGLALAVAAQLGMGDSWRIGLDPGERTDLVATGFFAVIRNPIFTGLVTISLGLALMVPNAVAIAGVLVVVVAAQVDVRLVEEPYLLAMHGNDYLGYAARVGRFVPWSGRLRNRAIRY